LTIENRLKEHFALVETSKKILKSTCQFYNFKEGTAELPVPNGCGILLKFNNNYYCFSNAHVLADSNLAKTFILLGGGKTMTIGGQYYYSKLPTTRRRNDDSLDITIVHLTNDTIEGLRQRGFEFLEISNVITGHSINEKDYLLVAGYAGSQTKIDNKNKRVIAKPFLFKTKAFTKSLPQLNIPKDFHFIAKYSRNKIFDSKTGKIKIGPKPYGISGSGLWLLKRNENSQYNPFLIGIFSEYLENRALLVSTKVDIFIDVIRHKVDPAIPNKGVQVFFIEDETRPKSNVSPISGADEQERIQ
jgi:hypothetical protein